MRGTFTEAFAPSPNWPAAHPIHKSTLGCLDLYHHGSANSAAIFVCAVINAAYKKDAINEERESCQTRLRTLIHRSSPMMTHTNWEWQRKERQSRSFMWNSSRTLQVIVGILQKDIRIFVILCMCAAEALAPSPQWPTAYPVHRSTLRLSKEKTTKASSFFKHFADITCYRGNIL